MLPPVLPLAISLWNCDQPSGPKLSHSDGPDPLPKTLCVGELVLLGGPGTALNPQEMRQLCRTVTAG